MASETPPSARTLYRALLERDPRFEGRYLVAVTSTGVFCRLTCPARKPRFDNCRFFRSADACLAAGFRACLRCHPLQGWDGLDPTVRTLVRALEVDPSRRWTESDLEARGLDPSTVRRQFKRAFGTTFLALARTKRLQCGVRALADGGRVIDAQLEAGFASASGFRASFARLLGTAPDRFTGRERLRAACFDTPLGTMIAVADTTALHLLEFADRPALPAALRRLRTRLGADIGVGRFSPSDQVESELQAYFRGEDVHFSTPLSWAGTAFEQAVWTALCAIPSGETRAYSELAATLGRPRAVRAVARANGRNVLAIVVPCHRVIGRDGHLTGYGGGLWRKRRLLELEAALASDDRRSSVQPSVSEVLL